MSAAASSAKTITSDVVSNATSTTTVSSAKTDTTSKRISTRRTEVELVTHVPRSAELVRARISALIAREALCRFWTDVLPVSQVVWTVSTIQTTA